MRTRRSSSASCTLLLTLLAPLAAGCGSQSSPRAAAPAARATATATRSVTAAPARRAVPSAQQPRSVTLPDGVMLPVRAVSTRSDGVLDVPEDIRTAGWWRGGSQIGDPFGVTLIAAHIDSVTQGVGPYAALLSVRAGQRVVVRTHRLQQSFVIRQRRLLPQGTLAGDQWVYRSSGPRRLVMVTCAPPYSKATGYQRLAVVVAVPAGEPSARSS